MVFLWISFQKYQHDTWFFLNLKFYNICMVFTCSHLKNMSFTSEMREHFENLMKPLATNETLGQ